MRQRGTAAHTALELDGLDSSEVWSSFRVGRRANPVDVQWDQQGDDVRVRAGHDGYRWLPGRPIHHREWVLSPRQLRVIDTVSGKFSTAIARFHLHPDWSIHVKDALGGWLEGRGRRILWRTEGACHIGVAASTWHPGFGVSLASQSLVIAVSGARLETCFSWE